MWRGRAFWAEIDLDAIAANVTALRRCLPPGTEFMAVVKANAYGHGAVQVARAVVAAGATWLGVNLADEGVQLRRAGLGCRILILGYVPPWEAEKVVFHSLTPTVNTPQQALATASASRWRGLATAVHVKVDTGMSRFGLLPEEVVPFLRQLNALPHLHCEGLWTHFATADEADKAFTYQQLSIYQQVVRRLDEAGLRPRYRHVANSAATLNLPEAHLDLVRCGIAIYGLYPSRAVGREVALRPALALKACVGRVSAHPAGTSVGYGRTYVAERDFVAALVPGGYADGLRRSLSNLGEVLVRGRRARILGRVSMDQVVVDVTHIPGVEVGDEVVVLGRQGEECITAEDLAAWTETINYEVVTAIAARVPRLYLREGRVVATETLVDQ